MNPQKNFSVWIRYSYILFALLCSCEQNSFSTANGIEVTYLKRGNGARPKQDSVLVIYMTQIDRLNRVLHQSSPSQPLGLKYAFSNSASDLQEVLDKLVVGDSVYFVTTIKNLFQETYGKEIPGLYEPESIVKINLKLAAQYTESGYNAFNESLTNKLLSQYKNDDSLTIQKYLRADGDSIDSWLRYSGASPEISTSGLRYVINQEGEGEQIVIGDKVSVQYSGWVLGNDYAPLKRNLYQTFTVGSQDVIDGWDEGLTYLKKGSVATFYIPSPLAYGSYSPNENIPPRAIMVFDIEVVEVNKKI